MPTSEMNVGDANVSRGQIQAVCSQLANADLIQWKPFSGCDEGFFIGIARITGLGVDVVNGSRAPSIDVHMKSRAENPDGHNVQADAETLLKAINVATTGSEIPVLLEDISSLPMSAEQAQAAFRYLKSKGLIEANFSIYSAARMSAAGHAAIAAALNPVEGVHPITTAEDKLDGEILTSKPGIWGMSIDIKEAVRWLRRHLEKGVTSHN